MEGRGEGGMGEGGREGGEGRRGGLYVSAELYVELLQQLQCVQIPHLHVC